MNSPKVIFDNAVKSVRDELNAAGFGGMINGKASCNGSGGGTGQSYAEIRSYTFFNKNNGEASFILTGIYNALGDQTMTFVLHHLVCDLVARSAFPKSIVNGIVEQYNDIMMGETLELRQSEVSFNPDAKLLNVNPYA